MRPIRSATFRGRRWAVQFCKPADPRYHGLCEGPGTPDKTISLDERMVGLGLLDLAIHEALHACVWDLDEDAVTETAWDIARFLHRLGFRRPEDDP